MAFTELIIFSNTCVLLSLDLTLSSSGIFLMHVEMTTFLDSNRAMVVTLITCTSCYMIPCVNASAGSFQLLVLSLCIPEAIFVTLTYILVSNS